MNDELIEQIARDIWEQQCQHWGRYRDQIPDMCPWDELTQSKQRELMREAKAAIAAMQPHIEARCEDAARRALADARGAVVELEIAAQDEAMRDYVSAFRDAGYAIRAIDPAQFRTAAP